MKGSMHISLGTAVGIAGALELYPVSTGASVAFACSCIIGSAFPDIDIAGSAISKRTRPAANLVGMVFGHRQFIHSGVNMLLLAWLGQMFLPGRIESWRAVLGGFLLGFFLHLVQDTCTVGGVPWLFPIRKQFCLMHLRSGSPFCWIITAGIAALVVCLMRSGQGMELLMRLAAD